MSHSQNITMYGDESILTPWISFPKGDGFGYFNKGGKFRIRKHISNRYYGNFLEKVLEVDKNGLISCKNICNERGFTIGYETITSKTYIITKIPVIVLIYIMRHDYDNCNIVQDIKGAYSIGMFPEQRTAMNIIVGRHININGDIVIEKFSLYYNNNNYFYEKYNNHWSLLDGFSLRTGIFGGDINISRRILYNLSNMDNNLTIDNDSAYDDAIYWNTHKDRLNIDRLKTIETSINILIQLGSTNTNGPLALSYNTELSDQNISCVEEEFMIFKEFIDK